MYLPCEENEDEEPNYTPEDVHDYPSTSYADQIKWLPTVIKSITVQTVKLRSYSVK